jgi:cell division protein FtsL
MSKSNKIFLLLLLILGVVLVVMTFLYLNMRVTAEENLNKVLETTEQNSKLNDEIKELKEKSSISTITNSTNTPSMTMTNNNVVVSNDTVSEDKVSEEKDYSIDIDKVNIEVDKSTISSKGVSIIITNNNENEISYGEEFKIQKKIDGEWKNLEYLPNTVWNALAYITKGNSQTSKKLNIENYYGELESGIYRVVKQIGNNTIYSDEFEIE